MKLKPFRVDPSLGGPIKINSPQIFENHPISEQHKIHLWKVFLFQILYQKNTHVGFETSIEFTKK
jgi:hypothetical protein